MSADLVLASLYRAADIVEDPAPAVYARLFATHPELEELFILDPFGAVRRNMLQLALECLMDHLDGKPSSVNMVVSERTNHSQLGIPASVFDDFYFAIRDAFGQLLGDDWSTATERAWTEAIEGLMETSRQVARDRQAAAG